MGLFEWKEGTEVATLEKTTFEELKKNEGNIQEMLLENIHLIDPDFLVLAKEYGDFDGSQKKIDLLCLDKQANLVVVELKRNEDRHMDLQAIHYAAMVSSRTFYDVIEGYIKLPKNIGKTKDDAISEVLDFLDWEEPQEEKFAQDVRIMLVAREFHPELTTTVLWLNERHLDITCVELMPYKHDGKILLDVQRIIPLPETESFRIQNRKRKLEMGKQAVEKSERQIRFWTELLLVAKENSDLHSRINTQASTWIAAYVKRLGFTYRHTRHGIQADLYIDLEDNDKNKNIFDQFHSNKEEIEDTFGGALFWERLDEKRASRISTGPLELDGKTLTGYKQDEEKWSGTIEVWVDRMIRFHKALRHHIDSLEL